MRLRSADAAIYGVVSSVRVLESPPVSGPPMADFGQRFEATVRVSRVFKGMTGRAVRVRGDTSGATCGIGELRVRQRLGLLLNGPSRPYQDGALVVRVSGVEQSDQDARVEDQRSHSSRSCSSSPAA